MNGRYVPLQLIKQGFGICSTHALKRKW